MNLSNSSANNVDLAKAIIPSNYLYIIFGISSFATNTLLIFVLLRSKREKNNFTYNMMQLGVADMFLGITAVCLGAKRYTTALNNEIPVRAECLVQLYCWYAGLAAGISQTFCMALDRLLSVTAPTLYHGSLHGPKMQLINLSQWLLIFAVCAIGPLKCQQPITVIPSCVAGVVFTAAFAQGFIFFLTGYSAVTVIIYIVIMIVVKLRVILVRKKHGNVKKIKKEMETKVLASVGLIVVFYFFTWLCGSIGAQIVSIFCPSTTSQVIVPYLPLVAVVNGSLNVLIYLWKNESVREDVAAVLFGKHLKPKGNTSVGGGSGTNINLRTAWAKT